jgi:hypothetical protein
MTDPFYTRKYNNFLVIFRQAILFVGDIEYKQVNMTTLFAVVGLAPCSHDG